MLEANLEVCRRCIRGPPISVEFEVHSTIQGPKTCKSTAGDGGSVGGFNDSRIGDASSKCDDACKLLNPVERHAVRVIDFWVGEIKPRTQASQGRALPHDRCSRREAKKTIRVRRLHSSSEPPFLPAARRCVSVSFALLQYNSVTDQVDPCHTTHSITAFSVRASAAVYHVVHRHSAISTLLPHAGCRLGCDAQHNSRRTARTPRAPPAHSLVGYARVGCI